MKFDQKDLFSLLEEKHDLYNRPSFIIEDPVSIPHLFARKEDIEISAFMSAMIAWGQRKSILSHAEKLVQMMDLQPYNFIIGFTKQDLQPFKKFIHRTFNGDDCIFFIRALRHIYTKHGGLENAFQVVNDHEKIYHGIIQFRKLFFETEHLKRSEKHIADPGKNSSCKRINLFLRWMIRNDQRGVDFGIWKSFDPAELICPLDIHTGNVARKLGIINRNQNDWKFATELTSFLRTLDAKDPVKYDFALFGLGLYEKF